MESGFVYVYSIKGKFIDFISGQAGPIGFFSSFKGRMYHHGSNSSFYLIVEI